MSVRSKFERQLDFKQLGWAYKIPDAGSAYKPFDYVVGIPHTTEAGTILRLAAIEAKKANGWTLARSAWEEHQRSALSYVESLANWSSWVAIGFLDIPAMKLDWNRKRIAGKLDKAAFLVPWRLYLELENPSCRYGDLLKYPQYEMRYGVRDGKYCWIIEKDHLILQPSA